MEKQEKMTFKKESGFIFALVGYLPLALPIFCRLVPNAIKMAAALF